MMDEEELPREAETPDGDRSQFLRAEFPFHAEPGEERDAEPASHGVPDGRIAPEFERDVQVGERPTCPLEALLQRRAGARTRLANDERFLGQGVERDGSTSRPRMTRGDQEHQRMPADRASLEGRSVGPLPDEPKRCPPLLDILDDRAAVADGGSHMDLRMLGTERRQQGREEAFSGDRAGRNRQVAGHRGMKAAEVSSSLFVQVEDLASELVEPLTGFGEGNTQLRVNGLYWGLDNLIYAANGRSDGEVRPRDNRPGFPLSIRRRDLRFRMSRAPGAESPPAAVVGQVEAIAGFSQFGLAHDDWGNRFPSWNTIPIRHVVLEQQTLDRNPYLAETSSIASILDHADGGRIFGNRDPRIVSGIVRAASPDAGSRRPAAVPYLVQSRFRGGCGI